MGSIAIHGYATVNEGSCNDGCGGSSGTTTQVPLEPDSGCTAKVYDAVPVIPLQLNTAGAIGAVYQQVALGLAAIEMLIIRASRAVRIRFDPVRPVFTTLVVGAGGIVTGSITLTIAGTDGTARPAVTVTFSGSTNTRDLVVAAINAALGGAGIPTPPDAPPAVLGSDNTIGISSFGVGPLARITATDTGASLLTAGTVYGSATDLPAMGGGTIVMPFDRNEAPAELWLSGQATLTIVAGGVPE